MLSPVRQLRLSATTTLPGHQDPRARRDKADFHVQCMKNVFSSWMVLLGTVIISVWLRIWTSSWRCCASPGTSTLLLPSPDVSTKGADESVGFLAHAMSNWPLCITRRVEAEYGGYVGCFWAGHRCPPECVNSSPADVPFFLFVPFYS